LASQLETQYLRWEVPTVTILTAILLVRLTIFILLAEKVGERVCLALLHTSPWAWRRPFGILFGRRRSGNGCSKETKRMKFCRF